MWLLAEPQLLDGGDQPCFEGTLDLEQGPERIETGWWDGRDVQRDYYVARNPAGVRLWVFRDRDPSGALVPAWRVRLSYPIGVPMSYAELHCLTNFSFLRGASHPEEMVERAVEIGYAALAITDECSVAGVVRAHVAAREHALPLIIGSEFRFVDGLQLVLLAASRGGYGQLCRLITRARRAASKGSYRLTRDDLAPTTGAPSNEAPHALDDCLALWLPGKTLCAADGRWLTGLFSDRLWIAVELLTSGQDRRRLASLQALGRELGLPLAAAGDVHMHARGRRALQDALTATRLRTTVERAGLALYPNGERHLRPLSRLREVYPPELLEETLTIAARCRSHSRSCATSTRARSSPRARHRRAGCDSSPWRVCEDAGPTVHPHR